MTLSHVALLLALSSGCASVSQDARSVNATHADESDTALVSSGKVNADETSGASDARAAGGAHVGASASRPRVLDGAALRHFYLLSPGPNATLVVTRSDLPMH